MFSVQWHSLNVNCSGYAAESLAEHLSLYTPVRIPYRAPIDWTKYGTYAATGLLLTTVARFITPLLKSRITWAVITIGTILVMTGGHMFVRIRGMPYSDGANWIAAGYQNQFGQETQVIALTCKLALCCMKRCVSVLIHSLFKTGS